jgi:glycosyltransferase A (GT-A) superfamily protein (DUF2064 family)
VESLDTHDLVLGEGQDGGYYLVGLKQLHRDLFKGIAWSTPRVLAQTLTQASTMDLRVSLVPRWYDVDTIEDLKQLESELLELSEDRLIHTRGVLADLGKI